ncbi:hypothetical protein I315_03317 [Cryptococcus gattii Ru294]|nr:hypothetical protein I315_03317 [Cryptococcus gattii Ru294]
MTTGLVDCVAESSTQALKQGRVSLTGPWRIGLHLLSIVARLPTPGLIEYLTVGGWSIIDSSAISKVQLKNTSQWLAQAESALYRTPGLRVAEL